MQKTTFKTRLLALLTAVFMVVMCVPFAAFAASETKTAHITFRAGENGTLNDGKDVVTYSVADVDGAKVTVPTVKAADGYEFTGWTCNTDAVLDAAAQGQEQFIAGWAYYYQDNTDGYVEFTANFKKKAEVKPVEKTAHITFRAVENGTLNDGKDVVTYDVADVDGAKVTVPTVKAADGYEFTGWTCNTDAVLDAAAQGQEQFIAGWAYYYQDNTDGYVEFTANFKKKAEVKPVEKTAHITFRAVENGTLNDGKDVVTYDVADVDGAKVTVPTVKAADGYEFTGWTCNTDAVLDAAAQGQKQFIAGWAFYYQDGPDGYVEFTANFKKKATETQKKFHVYFTVDPEKGSFTDYGKGPVTFEGYEDEVGNQQYNVPAVTAKPGYKFVGWKGQGASEIAWDADAKTFGVTGLCFYENGKDEGYASIEAVFEPTVKLTDIKVNFLKEDGKTVVCNAQYIAKDATLVLPYDVEGVTGWKLANNLTTYDVKTKFSFNDLAAFVGTNYAADGTANLTFYAQYKQDVKTDSTSTSSSSSNTTTTAASQQQVVKAAAAPANTTKVLPKTGATNAAPLIGGSLAVVALLMGYGVYGLVLRKKD